jgi:beta-glucosidase/6-phospho-beta-glucosidase/beta-galactosidase
MDRGANCFGYHMWASLDCWSWLNAYRNRYGYVEVDLTNQKRIPKKSAHWHRKMTQENGFNADFEPIETFIDLKKIKFEKSS